MSENQLSSHLQFAILMDHKMFFEMLHTAQIFSNDEVMFVLLVL